MSPDKARNERLTMRLLDADVLIGKLEKQRDELLAALGKMLTATEKALEGGRTDWLDAVCDARAALAKASGSP